MTVSNISASFKNVVSIDQPVRLVGKWATLIIIGWATTACVVGLTVIIGLPYGYRIVSQTCADKCFIAGQLTPTNAQDLQKLGISLETYALLYCLAFVVFTLICLGASWLLIWKKPGELMPYCAAIFLLALVAVEGAFVFYSDLFREQPGLALAFGLVAILNPTTSYVFLAFPNGQFKSRIYLYLCVCLVLVDCCKQVYTAFLQSGRGEAPSDVTVLISLVTVPLVLAIGFLLEKPGSPERKISKFAFYLLICLPIVVAETFLAVIIFVPLLLYRYFRLLTPHERQPTRWLLAGLILWLSTVIGVLSLPALFPGLNEPGSYYFLFSSFWGFFSCGINMAALLLAILYGNAFDMNIVISRTLNFTLLTGCVVGLYAIIVLSVTRLFGLESTNLAVSLLATGLIAVLFQPLRLGLQRGVNRILFGRRDEPYFVLSGLGQRLENINQPEAVLPELVNTLAATLKLPFVAVKLTDQPSIISRNHSDNYASSDPLVKAVSLPLSFQGENLGELLISPRRGEERIASRDLRLLQDLARQIGVVAYNLKLLDNLREANAELQTTNQDLRRARERLVLAREEERRRLRRDLHDDLAPSLAGLALSADALSGLIRHDPAKAQVKSQELYTAIRSSVGDIRRLAHDLRQPTLDEFGLVAALKERAQQFSNGNILVRLETPLDLPPLPAAVEVAAYRVAQEALMNVIKHAAARSCCIKLLISPTLQNRADLILEISDDGRGLPDKMTNGVGLRSMREQAEELGGTFELKQNIDGGTTVRVVLPIDKPTEGSNQYEPASSISRR